MNDNNAEQHDIRNDPTVESLLAKMPIDIADSFTDEQLVYLKTAVASRKRAKHMVDFRGIVSFPYFKWQYYYLFVWGRNSRREMSPKEKSISLYIKSLLWLLIFFALFTVLLLIVYLLKSAAGIDLIPNYSFGIWNEFKSLF